MPDFACFCCKRLALALHVDAELQIRHRDYDFCQLESSINYPVQYASRHVYDGQGQNSGTKLDGDGALAVAISHASYQRLNHEVFFKAFAEALLQKRGNDTFDEYVWRQSFRFLYPECERLAMALNPHGNPKTSNTSDQ
jgi:hypothetical protein